MNIAIIKADPTDIPAYQKVIGVLELQVKPNVGELIDFEGQFLEAKQVVNRQVSSRMDASTEAVGCPIWVIV